MAITAQVKGNKKDKYKAKNNMEYNSHKYAKDFHRRGCEKARAKLGSELVWSLTADGGSQNKHLLEAIDQQALC